MVRLRRRDEGNPGDFEWQMERFLDRYVGGWKRPLVTFSSGEWQPAIDVYETPDRVVVVADLAGVRVEDIEITVDRGHLLLHGRRTSLSHPPNAQFHYVEITRGTFNRVIQLPIPVDPDGAAASYQDGFLEIVLPKASRSPSTTVKIRTA